MNPTMRKNAFLASSTSISAARCAGALEPGCLAIPHIVAQRRRAGSVSATAFERPGASALKLGVEADVHAGERLADRAGRLGLCGRLGELVRGQAVDLATDGELDAGQPEAACRVGPQRDVGLHVQRLRRAAGLS